MDDLIDLTNTNNASSSSLTSTSTTGVIILNDDFTPSPAPPNVLFNVNIDSTTATSSGGGGGVESSCINNTATLPSFILSMGPQNDSLYHRTEYNSLNSCKGLQQLKYKSQKHAVETLSMLGKMRLLDNGFTDVLLIVNNHHFRAHKCVLAAASPYFKAMFCSELSESKQDCVTLHDLDEGAVKLLIDFCYESEITVDETNVQTLLPASSWLQLTEVQEQCCSFLKNQLDACNCLGIRQFADQHHCRDLLEVADKFTQNNFEEVVKSEEFLQLPVNRLIQIIAKDDLFVPKEEFVFQAIMRWVQFDTEERKGFLYEILSNVRLVTMSAYFLVNTVGTNDLVRADKKCFELIDEAKNYLLVPQYRSKYMGPCCKPRSNYHEVLFAVGGWCNGDAINTVERYDVHSNSWYSVSSMRKRRCGVGVGVLHDLIFAVGGHDGHNYLNSVESYSHQTDSWTPNVAPTSSCRTSVGVAVLHDKMYAVGGQDGVSCLNYVECYDPNADVWVKVSNMSTRRLGVGVAVWNGALFAVGGSDGQKPLDTVERFDPRCGMWFPMSKMKTPRKHLGVAVYNNYVHAVGGRDEGKELNTAEWFDPRLNQWLPLSAMCSRRSGVGLAVVNNELMAIGGFDGCNYLRSVEKYDCDANSWHVVGQMMSRRLGGGVGVLKAPFLYS